MKLYNAQHQDGQLVIEPTRAGRLAGAAWRFVTWMPVAAVGLSILFMPDYLCQYREQQPVPGMFWMVMLLAALFIAAIGAFVKFARRDVWVFDAEAGEVRFRAEPLFGASAQTSADLSKWQGAVADRSSMLWQSRIAVRLEDHPDEPICESRFGWESLEEVWRALSAFVDEHELNVHLDEASTG